MAGPAARRPGRTGAPPCPTAIPSLGLGCRGLNWAYGPADRDESIAGRRDEVTLATTFGIRTDPTTGYPDGQVNGSPEYCSGSGSTTSSWYLHRPDPATPVEETVGAPIAALQSEWSLFSRDIEESVVPAAREAARA